jgi:hypothetical protein
MTLDEFFSGRDKSRQIFESLRAAIEALGPVEIRVTKSQVTFRRRRAFAWAWVPDRYLRGRHVPLVLTVVRQAKQLAAMERDGRADTGTLHASPGATIRVGDRC